MITPIIRYTNGLGAFTPAGSGPTPGNPAVWVGSNTPIPGYDPTSLAFQPGAPPTGATPTNDAAFGFDPNSPGLATNPYTLNPNDALARQLGIDPINPYNGIGSFLTMLYAKIGELRANPGVPGNLALADGLLQYGPGIAAQAWAQGIRNGQVFWSMLPGMNPSAPNLPQYIPGGASQDGSRGGSGGGTVLNVLTPPNVSQTVTPQSMQAGGTGVNNQGTLMMNQLPSSPDAISTWIQNNWVILAAAAGALFILPMVMKK